MNKAIFFDRDGVINHDYGYISKISDFKIISGVVDSLKFFDQKGFKKIIITNQSGIGRGFFSVDEYHKINRYMIDYLKKKSIKIDGVYYCPHTPEDACMCRKPNNELIEIAIQDFNISRNESYFIGDKISDMEASKKSRLKKCFLIENTISQESNSTKYRTFKNLKDLTSSWDEIA